MRRYLKTFGDRLPAAPGYVVSLVLLAGFFSSAILYFAVRNDNQRTVAARFHAASEEIADTISRRLMLYERGLYGARGAIIAMGAEASRQRFHWYAASRDFEREFPGARGFGFVRRIAPAAAERFQTEVRQDGAPDFQIRQTAPHDGDLMPIVYVEPLAGNAQAIGLDIASEPRRRAAALHAAETGATTITAPLTLLQAPDARDQGFLILTPIYQPGQPHGTMAERETALIGWSYAPVLAPSVFADGLRYFRDLGFSLEDTAAANTFFVLDPKSPGIDLVDDRVLRVFQREWRLKTAATEAFAAKFGLPSPLILAVTAFVAVALFAAILQVYLRAQSRARLVMQERMRLATIVESSSDAIISTDEDGFVLSWNEGAERLYGYRARDALGRQVAPLIIPADRMEELRIVLKKLRRGESVVSAATERVAQDGNRLATLVSYSALRDVNGTIIGYASIERDIRAQKETEAEILRLNAQLEQQVAERTRQLETSLILQHEIRHMALHDALTGLPNRRLFRDKLIAALDDPAEDPAFAVLVCDLDRFKAVNDTYGHPIGDEVLKEVAARLRRTIRDHDVVARFAGDEFAVLLADARSAAGVAEGLIAAINEPMRIDGLRIAIGLSVGIAHAGVDAVHDPDELVKRADTALYRAKAAGRNTFQSFQPEAHARMSHHSHLALELREALRRGDFRLAFQPLLDSRSENVCGFEALARWPHPARDIIPPSEFIPLAEDTGLIVPLGRWALTEACRAATAWPHDVKIAVNVSAVQIRQDGLEAAVHAALGQSGLPAARLEIEVTESVLLRDADEVLACLRRLQNLGVAIVLDDFGTGFSSLSYLRSFGFDKIKIDRTFIRDIGEPDAAAIVQGIVGIGERLGKKMVAEGIETRDQFAFVREIGCSAVQGYLFSRPLTEVEARDFAWRQRRPMTIAAA